MAHPRPQLSGLCFRHFRFDRRRKRTDARQILRVEITLHKFDPEMPFDFQHELKNVDGIDFQFSAEKRVIVAEVRGGQIGDPQATQYDGLELFANARHKLVYKHGRITQRSIGKSPQERLGGLRKAGFVGSRTVEDGRFYALPQRKLE